METMLKAYNFVGIVLLDRNINTIDGIYYNIIAGLVFVLSESVNRCKCLN